VERKVLIREHPTVKDMFLIRIIDFGASRLHERGFEGEFIEYNGLQPDEKVLGFDELHGVCHQAEVWYAILSQGYSNQQCERPWSTR